MRHIDAPQLGETEEKGDETVVIRADEGIVYMDSNGELEISLSPSGGAIKLTNSTDENLWLSNSGMLKPGASIYVLDLPENLKIQTESGQDWRELDDELGKLLGWMSDFEEWMGGPEEMLWSIGDKSSRMAKDALEMDPGKRRWCLEKLKWTSRSLHTLVIRGYLQLRNDAEAGKPYKTSRMREEEKRVEKEVQTGLFGGDEG